MGDVLSAAQVQELCSFSYSSADEAAEQGLNRILALARSHEQLRERLRESEIAVYDVLAQIEQLRGERDAAQHIIDCADTPLMRDVLKRMHAAEAAVRAGGEAADLADALRAIAAEDELVEANDAAFSIHAFRRCQAIAREALASLSPDEEQTP